MQQKTKPDSLTNQGLPGINTAKIVFSFDLNKSRSTAQCQYNNTYMFNELDGINILRNRIAHHEPICFALRQPVIDTSYLMNSYNRLQTLFEWMDIHSKSLLYGLDHVKKVCSKINNL